MIATSLSAIKEALIMDMVDVYKQNDTLRSLGGKAASNYLMLLPQIFVTVPFPTMALFFWFYTKAFTSCNAIIRIGLLTASVVQAVLSIIVAGRAALIYWIFDFFLLFGYFYQYLSPRLKKGISVVSLAIGGIIISQMLVITISRFGDESGRGSQVDPLVSLYAYAGQHVNNFCSVISDGGDSPLQIGRIFPLTNKIVNHQDFDLIQHYENIHASVNIIVNVFDTFGGEIFLDLGWFGYIVFFFNLRHHLDGLQNVVNTMGVDLVLQGANLGVFHQDLTLDIGLHQRLDAVQHLIELGSKLSHLVGAVIIHPHIQVPLLDSVNAVQDGIELTQHGPHNPVNTKGGDKQHECRNHDKNHPPSGDVAHILRNILYIVEGSPHTL
jgi:hypothetical protein